jgi:hypothetical protein
VVIGFTVGIVLPSKRNDSKVAEANPAQFVSPVQAKWKIPRNRNVVRIGRATVLIGHDGTSPPTSRFCASANIASDQPIVSVHANTRLTSDTISHICGLFLFSARIYSRSSQLFQKLALSPASGILLR